MKNLLVAITLTAFLFSCNNASDKGVFTVEGEIKSVPDQKVYLEELYFSDKEAEVIDTGVIKNGKFVVGGIAPEEGLYRLRLENGSNAYVFISQPGKIEFKADVANNQLSGYSFSGPANSSLKKLMRYTDSTGLIISNKDRLLGEFIKAGVSENDSTYMAISNEYKSMTDEYTKYAFAYADTAKYPVVAMFAATMAPVEIGKFEKPLSGLATRFPKHKGVAGALTFIKERAAQQSQAIPQADTKPLVGKPAPDFTMNDVNGKSFSLNQLRGKYVLIDFWASWCVPCREENPNVVAAFNQYKDKNFTVLGVSLDKNKEDWVAAIATDGLAWQHISDLKQWNSAAVPLYGIDGIPYNVLIDPQGKIIATDLRASALQNKLKEVLQ